MNRIKLPGWANELLASCPGAGKGVHKFCYIAALKLHRCCSDPNEIARLLDEATQNCGREVSDSEIQNAVRDSRRFLENSSGQTQTARRWPNRNEKRIEAIVRDGPNFAKLADLSPVKWDDDARHTEEICDALFPRDSLLCAAPSKFHALTRTREQWRGFLEKQQFIVPNPMSATHGVTQGGKRSMRTLDNTGPRRFLVVEFDAGSFDRHAAVLSHLAKFAPLAMVVHSGNKSLHGWFYCDGQPEEKVKKFFNFAVWLGADPATWTPCQLVRMPDGQRENGTRQRAIYFNPKGNTLQ